MNFPYKRSLQQKLELDLKIDGSINDECSRLDYIQILSKAIPQISSKMYFATTAAACDNPFMVDKTSMSVGAQTTVSIVYKVSTGIQ